MYSVLVNLMRAAWRMASAREVKCEEGRVENWLPLSGRMTSLVALRSMSRAPTAMAAFSCSVSQSGASRVSVMVSSWMLAILGPCPPTSSPSASARRRVHSGISSTSLRATGISHSGSSESETRMVSPMPSVSSAPMPTADLMRPSSPSPASVTPRCRG